MANRFNFDEDLILRRNPYINSFPVHHPITIRTTGKRERRFIWDLPEDIGVFHGVKYADDITWSTRLRAKSEKSKMSDEKRAISPLARQVFGEAGFWQLEKHFLSFFGDLLSDLCLVGFV